MHSHLKQGWKISYCGATTAGTVCVLVPSDRILLLDLDFKLHGLHCNASNEVRSFGCVISMLLTGMVTSLWIMSESLGGFVGAMAGGAAYDM